MSETSLRPSRGLYEAVHIFANDLNEAALQTLPEDANCIEHAAYVQDQFCNLIGGLRELQSADIECGVVFTIDRQSPAADTTKDSRIIHFSNYILARRETSRALVELDSWGRTITKVTSRTDPVALTSRSEFGHYSVAYGQRLSRKHAWKSGIASNIREVPGNLYPFYHQKAAMGPNIGRVALAELQRLGKRKIDITKLPAMLLEARS